MNNTNYPDYDWSFKDVFILFGVTLIIILIIVPLDCFTVRIIVGNPYMGEFILALCFFSFLYIYLKKKKIAWSNLGFSKKGSLHMIFKGVFSGLVVFLIISLIFAPKAFVELCYKINIINIYVVIFIFPFSFIALNSVFLTPLVEEILSRGILFQAMEKKYNALFSIVMVSLIDSLMHIDSLTNFNCMLIRTIDFICITYLFYKYRNIAISIACHCTLNYLVLSQDLLLHATK